MDNNTKGFLVFLAFIIGVGFMFRISGYLYETFDIPYSTSISITCVLVAILFIGGSMLLYKKYDWYKELINKEFRAYRKLFSEYRTYVIYKNYNYDVFVIDYCSHNLHNLDIGESIEEVREKNVLNNRIVYLLTDRKDLIAKYFHKDSFDYKDFLEMQRLFNTTLPEKGNNSVPNEIDIQEKLEKVKAEILKYESGEETPKHYGHRMFGYLLKEKYFNALNDDQRLKEWQEFTKLKSKPEMDYLRNPDSNKNNTDKINQQLKEIKKIFDLIGLKVTITYHQGKPKTNK